MLEGMQAQGFDVELKRFPAAWRATFYRPGELTRSCMHRARADTVASGPASGLGDLEGPEAAA